MEAQTVNSSTGRLEYNPVISAKERHNPRHKVFLDWCHENGMKWKSIDFPAYFGANGELRGVVTTKEISPYEIVLAVPNKLLMSSLKAKEEHDLKPIFKSHKDIFDDEEDGEHFVLILYLLYERAKGKKSFYFPFINLVPEIETSLNWSDEILKTIECPAFLGEIEAARLEVKLDWETLEPVFTKHSKLFGE